MIGKRISRKDSDYMPTYPRSESPEEIEKKIKEGRGSGTMENYRAWIQTHEVTSAGNSTVAWSFKLGRKVHLLSDGEYYLWYVLESSAKVIDYWEQYPLLPIDKTIEIAKEHNIPYPKLPRPKNQSIRDPKIITTDFVASVLVNGNIEYHPLSFKRSGLRQNGRIARSNTLEDKRTLLKLEIERLLWQYDGHRLRIITEIDIPKPVWQNLKQIQPRYYLGLTDEKIQEIGSYLTHRIRRDGDQPLRKITKECDRKFGYPEESGTALSVVWHLIARHKWRIDLTTLVDTDKPLRLISFNL
jgi:hypothetical protein